MALAEENTRILVTINKKQKEQLEALAKKDKRSISNLCAKILTDYIDSLSGGDKK